LGSHSPEENNVYIIRIGSFFDFFSGAPIKLEAALNLRELDYTTMIGVHMSRSRYISVIGKTSPDDLLPEEAEAVDP
jgi:hypothetical protein